MVHVLTELSKYLVIILFAVYTLSSFTVLFRKTDPDRERRVFIRQAVCMYALHFLCYLVIFAVEQEGKIWALYLGEVGLTLVIYLIYRIIYQNADRLIVHHMCMLMLIGFAELTRLDFEAALHQFEVAILAVVITAFVPRVVVHAHFIRKLTWVYGVIGILVLGAVLVLGSVTYGAKISFTVAGITLQPSELIKIIFVFFVACRLYRSTAFKDVVVTTIAAALHVIILVLSSDLGAALIFFVTYICMLFVATRAPVYLLGGFGVGAVAAFGAAKVFNHVKTRVAAWKDPFANIDGGGYQVAQAMFAIGTGGWFGLGLYQGMPHSIPVETSDFIFAAIAEEFGGIFAICIILVCLSCFVMLTRVARQIHDVFYQMIALGFGVAYGTQVFLNIGGVIKFIPSTGVTLPFISYGGTSIFCTVVIFAIIQGIYILRHNENEIYVEDFDLEPQEVKPVRRNEGGAEEVLRRHMQRQTEQPKRTRRPQAEQPARTKRPQEELPKRTRRPKVTQEEIKGFWDEEEDRVQKTRRRQKRTQTEYEEKW
jgi:cell division protein FtsW (lipid II flippase)